MPFFRRRRLSVDVSDSPPASPKRRNSILRRSMSNLLSTSMQNLESNHQPIPIRVKIDLPEPCESFSVCLVPRHSVCNCVHLAETGFAPDDMTLAYLDHGPLSPESGLTLELPDAHYAVVNSKINTPESPSSPFWQTIITAGVVRVPPPRWLVDSDCEI